MLSLETTKQFRKDYKRMKKQGKNMALLEEVINKLLAEEVLDDKYQDHKLINNRKGYRECHILDDWLLIYSIDKKKLILTAVETGSHSELFNK